MEAVATTCGFATEGLQVACDEPPCMALFEAPPEQDWRERLMGCDAWSESYDGAWNQVEPVHCDDGEGRQVVVLQAPWNAFWDGLDAEVRRERRKRLDWRIDEALRSWPCTPAD